MTKVVISAALLLLTGLTLLAQPPVVQSARPGIRSVTRSICGYGFKGDSTGMKFYSYREYNTTGHLTIKGETQTIATEWNPNAASSWYYYEANSIKPGVDSTRFVYLKDGNIGEVKHRDRSGARTRTAFTYDAQGNCVKQQEYVGNTADQWKNFFYDTTGVLIKSVSGVGKSETTTVQYEYDSLGRQVRQITTRSTIGGIKRDTVTTTYMSSSKVVYSSGYLNSRKEILYTQSDSVKAVYIQYTFFDGRISTDTTLNHHDPVTHQLLKTTIRNGSGEHTVEYEYKDRVLVKRTSKTRGVITSITLYNESAQPVSKESFNQNGRGQWSSEYWLYNGQRDLVDYKLYGASGQLLQHEVYSYRYY